MNRKLKLHILPLLLLPLVFTACAIAKFGYSFSQGAIPADVKTVSVSYFPNNALLVAPILSSTFTDALKDRFIKQSRLTLVNEGEGDLNFEGEITNYTTSPASVSADEVAVRNNLTISVRVRFTNRLYPEQSYDKTFTSFLPYNTNQMLQEVEPTLIPEIVDQLVEDIFNAAVSQW